MLTKTCCNTLPAMFLIPAGFVALIQWGIYLVQTVCLHFTQVSGLVAFESCFLPLILWNCVQTFMVRTGWSILCLEVPWPYSGTYYDILYRHLPHHHEPKLLQWSCNSPCEWPSAQRNVFQYVVYEHMPAEIITFPLAWDALCVYW